MRSCLSAAILQIKIPAMTSEVHFPPGLYVTRLSKVLLSGKFFDGASEEPASVLTATKLALVLLVGG